MNHCLSKLQKEKHTAVLFTVYIIRETRRFPIFLPYSSESSGDIESGKRLVVRKLSEEASCSKTPRLLPAHGQDRTVQQPLALFRLSYIVHASTSGNEAAALKENRYKGTRKL